MYVKKDHFFSYVPGKFFLRKILVKYEKKFRPRSLYEPRIS